MKRVDCVQILVQVLQKGSEMSDIYDPEDWATCIVRAVATILMVSKGQGVPSVSDFLKSLLQHHVFLRHLTGMHEASSALVMKAGAGMAPIEAAMVSAQLAKIKDELECQLHDESKICDDLMECFKGDDDELFFEVYVSEEVAQTMRMTALDGLIREWGAHERELFQTI